MTLWQLVLAQFLVPAVFFLIAFVIAGTTLSGAARETLFLVMLGLQILLVMVVLARSVHVLLSWITRRRFSLAELGFIMLSALLTSATWFATIITGLLLIGFS